MNFESPSIRNGVLAGVAGVIISLLFYISNISLFFKLSSWVVIVVYVVFMVKAAKEDRARVEHFGFKEAFKSTFITFVVGSVINLIFYYVLMNFVDPDLIEVQKEIAIEQVEKMGSMMGEDQLEAMVQGIQEQDMQFTLGRALYTFAFSLVFPGGLAAAIISAVMRDKSQ